MALDDLYADSINESIRNRATLSPVIPRPEPGFSFWGTLKAPFTGAASGALEAGAFWSEMVGAFGTVSAAYGGASGSPLPLEETESQRVWREQGQARARADLESGEFFSNEFGDQLRDAARWMGPDRETAGYAESILYDASRVITKAVGYSMAGGILPGAIATGVDEGATVSDELRQQGVDLSTRTQAGAAAAAATAVGVALPVAGRSLASTAGLVVAGGPATFIAQNAFTQSLLENAGYENLAGQYDPFDPVGLAVSTLLPAAFGGWALRTRSRAQTKGADVPSAEESPQAQGTSDPDLVDAARVQRAREVVDAWNLADPADVRAANDAMMAVMRASSQLADGVPVSVADSFPLKDAYAARAIDRMIERSEATKADLLPQAELVADAGAIRAMRGEIDTLRQQRPDPSDNALVRRLADQIRQNEPRTSQRAAMAQARRELEAQAGDAEARIAALEQQIEDNAQAVEARRAVKLLEEQIEQMKRDRDAINAPATELTPLSAAMREAGITRPDGLTRPAPTQASDTGRTATESATPAPETAPQPATPLVTPAAMMTGVDPLMPSPKMPAGIAQITNDARIDSRIAELQTESPDALVRLEGTNQDIPLTEALARLQDEASRADADADLLMVAARCAIGAI